jgi:hypothetical protein
LVDAYHRLLHRNLGNSMNDTSKVPVVAGNAIRAIVPASLDEAYRLAQAFVAGGIAPRGMQRPEQIMVAIMAGLEVGLTPLRVHQGGDRGQRRERLRLVRDQAPRRDRAGTRDVQLGAGQARWADR